LGSFNPLKKDPSASSTPLCSPYLFLTLSTLWVAHHHRDCQHYTHPKTRTHSHTSNLDYSLRLDASRLWSPRPNALPPASCWQITTHHFSACLLNYDPTLEQQSIGIFYSCFLSPLLSLGSLIPSLIQSTTLSLFTPHAHTCHDRFDPRSLIQPLFFLCDDHLNTFVCGTTSPVWP
jgi:hypothetical protein